MEQPIKQKRALRRLMMQRRNGLAGREVRSQAICERVAGLAFYQAARVMHCYLPMRSEVDTLPLVRLALAQGRRVAVPLVRPGAADLEHGWLDAGALDELEMGIFGTLQPRVYAACDPAQCELFVVPLLAFDRSGLRLGYGKGFYDRLLATVRAPAVGVAFAIQELPQLPAVPHDVPLDAVVTENEVFSIVKKGG